MTQPVIWLAWRELAERKSLFFAAIGLMALAAALCTSLELVMRARELAVQAQINNIGPALRLIPAGRTAGDLARFDLGAGYLTEDEVDMIGGEISPRVRSADARLLLNEPLEGTRAAIIGVSPRTVVSPFEELARLGDAEAALGSELARLRGKKKGDTIMFKGAGFRVAAVLAQSAGPEDAALFLPLRRLQTLAGLPGAVNEIRIFPRPGEDAGKIAASLKPARFRVSVIDAYRGAAAETEVGAGLARYRWAVYGIISVVAAFCVLIWSYLNARERTSELALIAALGGTGRTVLSILAVRAAIVGLAGAVLGCLAGAGFAFLQDPASALGAAWSWSLPLAVSAAALALGVLGALPVAFLAALGDHAAALQE